MTLGGPDPSWRLRAVVSWPGISRESLANGSPHEGVDPGLIRLYPADEVTKHSGLPEPRQVGRDGIDGPLDR